MYSKLSIRNMKRSISDYSIYALTLTLAVALFYIFNCLGSQQMLLDLSKTQSEMLTGLENIMSAASIAVAIIFCILCLFANQFLVKRRKKEFGLYMTLGMSKAKISSLLVLETSLMGLVSLGIGLVLGIILSQGMASFTAKLFDVAIIKYSFLISGSAIAKTIMFFILIFVLVMIFNTISISRYSLIELLTASKKGQRIWLKNTVASGILFVLSLGMIIGSYVTINSGDIFQNISPIIIGIPILLVGSVLFYFAGSSFILVILKKWRGLYFKGINIFNIRQLSSKVSTAIISIITIQFLLFFTITILSSGINYKASLENELKIVAPFDGTVAINNYARTENFDLDKMIEKIGIDFEKNHKDNYLAYNIYMPDNSILSEIHPYALGSVKSSLDQGIPYEIKVIKKSDYEKLMKLQDVSPISIGENETLILTNMNSAQATIKNVTSNISEFKIGGEGLKLHSEKYQIVGIETENVGRTLACFVVPDKIVSSLNPYLTLINYQFVENAEKLNEEYNILFERMIHEDILDDFDFNVRGMSQSSAYEMIAGETGNLLFIGIYLGFVFLVSSGAVLGLRLLSDASDDVERYKTMDRLGATKRSMDNSVLVQVLAYFGAPLLLAIPNSIFTFYFINKCIGSIGAEASIVPAIFTAAIIFLLYGGYLVVTYLGYKRIVRRK